MCPSTVKLLKIIVDYTYYRWNRLIRNIYFCIKSRRHRITCSMQFKISWLSSIYTLDTCGKTIKKMPDFQKSYWTRDILIREKRKFDDVHETQCVPTYIHRYTPSHAHTHTHTRRYVNRIFVSLSCFSRSRGNCFLRR